MNSATKVTLTCDKKRLRGVLEEMLQAWGGGGVGVWWDWRLVGFMA